MIVVHSLPGAWDLPSISAFCLKVEAYFRFADVDYEVVLGDLRRAPKGKAPWITDGDVVVPDSSDIIRYLEKKSGRSLDDRLDDRERQLSHLVQRTVEEHLYFGMLWFRWTSDDAWPHLRAALKPALPPVVGGLIAWLIRRSVRQSAMAQGLGRHPPDEILARMKRDLDAIAAILGDKPFLFGDAPSNVDATVYATLAQMLGVPWDAAERRLVEGMTTLVAYRDRIRERYF
jgi:glutathione S-transferase